MIDKNSLVTTCLVFYWDYRNGAMAAPPANHVWQPSRYMAAPPARC